MILEIFALVGAATVLLALSLLARYGWLRFQEWRTSTRRYLRRATRW